jgi:hypothetical protein
MRLLNLHSRHIARGVVAVFVAMSVGIPVTAFAAGPATVTIESSESVRPDAADVRATVLPESSTGEKLKAIAVIEIGTAANTWLTLSDKDFVFKVYDKIDPNRFPLTRTEAYRIFQVMTANADAPDATAFIRTGIFDFADRDRLTYARRQDEAHQAREARQKAAAFAEITMDAAVLDGDDRNFIFQVWQHATGPKVKDGAATALAGDAAVWKTFITTTIYDLHRQDQLDAVAKARADSEDKARELAARQSKANAAALLGITAPEGWLAMPDDNFIRQLLASAEVNDPRRTEVRNAADAALRSSKPADWRTFIDTTIYQADKRDAAREKAAREEADRQRVREIRAKADNGGVQPRLVAAADAALADGPDEVTRFLSDTRYAVLNQALMATSPGSRGWYVRSGGGNAWISAGTPVPAGDVPLGSATWTVVAGLADATCFSFESVEHVGSYLRQHDSQVALAASDGSDQYKADATWCSRPGLAGAGVSLESKASPGRFLRHKDSRLWAANDNGQLPGDGDAVAFKQDATWTVADPDPVVTTPIMLRWFNDDGWRAGVGASKAGEVIDGEVRYRDFADARAYYSPAGGVHDILTGPILDKYLAAGGHEKLKAPTADTEWTPDNIGRYNHLADSRSIYWSPATGAHLIYGAIRDLWASLGWETSYLGYPISDEEQAGALRRSRFEHGTIDHDPATGKTWDYHTG